MANAETHTDHRSKEWPSLRAMCSAYGVSPTTYLSRLDLGWTVEQALTSDPSKRTECNAWPGRPYPSMRDLAKAMDVPYNAMNRLLTHFSMDGWKAIEQLCRKYWPGKVKNGLRIISCNTFPWCLCDDMAHRNMPIIVRADKLLPK